jgi:hypothetical protein
VLLEDLKKEPRSEYLRVLEFLGIEDDGRCSFPVKNVGKVPRLLWLAQIGRILGRLKKQLGIQQKFGIQRWFNRRNQVPRENPKIDSELQAELIDYFKDDVKKLSNLINRDLSHWLSSSTNKGYINSGATGIIKNRRDTEGAESEVDREKLNNSDTKVKDISSSVSHFKN